MAALIPITPAQVPLQQDEGSSILSLCNDIGQKPSWNSNQIAELHKSVSRVSLELSEQRVEVTGSSLLINPNSSMPR
jgi:hypothetical protein